MRINFGIFALLCLGNVFCQENYSTWAKYKDVTINTTSTGANVSGGVANFPLLVRLTSANADVFSQSAFNGADIRFTDSTGTVRLKHERERWDTTGKVAEFWVLVPSVAGNAVTTFRIYWGKIGASDSSNGKAVFDTSNGFTGVWHMNEAQGTGPKDATANSLHFTAHASVTRAVGIIDSARTYAGGTAGTPDSIARSDKFNVTNMMFTISAWVNRPAANSSQYEGIFSNWRYSSGATRSYILEQKSNGSYAVQVSSGGTADDRIPATSATFSNAAWHHVVGSMSPANGIRIFVDGVNQGLNGVADAIDPFVNTSDAARPLIGAMERANTQPFIGSIDEVELSVNTERSADWIKLDYETQKAGATAVTLGSSITLVPGAPYVTSSPASKTVLAGSTVKFGVVAAGNATLVYKWVRRNLDTVGTNSDSLTLANVSNADTGSYKCVVRNSLGQAVSGSATLALMVAPVIVTNPVDVSIGTPVNNGKFWVVANGTAPFTYQWIRTKGVTTDTLTSTGIFSGTATDTLRFTDATKADSGSTFKCKVGNVVGSAVSSAATFNVSIPVGILSGKNGRAFAIQTLGSFVKFQLPDGIYAARVTIMDVWGRKVWSHNMNSGAPEASWDGRLKSGLPASGVYFVRLTTDTGRNPKVLAETKFTLVP